MKKSTQARRNALSPARCVGCGKRIDLAAVQAAIAAGQESRRGCGSVLVREREATTSTKR